MEINSQQKVNHNLPEGTDIWEIAKENSFKQENSSQYNLFLK